MKIVLQYENSNISLKVSNNMELEISFENDKEILKTLLEAIYKEINTEDFLKTLDLNQLQEISEYYETVKDKK